MAENARDNPLPLKEPADEEHPLLTREWLVTNGLGGYASGTVAGVLTRRYHGLLIAALPAPFGRWVMLNALFEHLVFPDGERVQLTGEECNACSLQLRGAIYLSELDFDRGLPCWRYRVRGTVIEKRIFFRHEENTVQVRYRHVSGDGPVILELHPAVQFRPQNAMVEVPIKSFYSLSARQGQYDLAASPDLPRLKMQLYGYGDEAFTARDHVFQGLIYRTERACGYESRGDLYSPGFFRVELAAGQDVTFIASTEDWDKIVRTSPEKAFAEEVERRRLLFEKAYPVINDEQGKELVIAADQFIIVPPKRWDDIIQLTRQNIGRRTVIAGYHWFTDWGRDTMISLEGLTLVTGRHEEAGWILRTFSHYIREGLIPNMFPEGGREGLYNTADATLWYFHAVKRYLDYTGDRELLRNLLPKLVDIIGYHLRGTLFNIRADPDDGLLSQGQEGFALTWMDAKVGDWVVTPRRGKAVEINALWYNALRLTEQWVREEQGEAAARPLAAHAEKARESFNRRFWYEKGGYLYDVVDGENGDDPACRPNQVLAISLDNPVVEESKWDAVMRVVTGRLLTPDGLRTLAPGSPDYHPRYFGDVRARDAAYHQGTVWPWLIGPYIDAWLKLHPDERTKARNFLYGLAMHLVDEACIGSVSEVFDAEAPFVPRGCIAQAWSVAEVLRAWVKTAPPEPTKGGENL